MKVQPVPSIIHGGPNSPLTTEAEPSAPVRVQLSRARGWRMPPNTVKVTRPGPWGNPFNLRDGGHCWTAVALGFRADPAGRQAASVELYRRWLGLRPNRNPLRTEGGVIEYADGSRRGVDEIARGIALWASAEMGPKVELPASGPPSRRHIKRTLRGLNLACWCKLGEPCHADVLLALANAVPVTRRAAAPEGPPDADDSPGMNPSPHPIQHPTSPKAEGPR